MLACMSRIFRKATTEVTSATAAGAEIGENAVTAAAANVAHGA